MSEVQTQAAPAAEKANGLATYFNVIFSPAEAFSTLGRVPMWGWAAICGILLTVISQTIGSNAIIHMAHVGQAQALANMPADQAAQAKENMSKIPDFVYPLFGILGGGLIGPWVAWIIGALIYLITAALSGGEARFKLAWVTAVNLYAIAGLGAVVAMIIVALRGAENIASAVDMFSLPSLAMIIHSGPKVAAALYTFNIVNIWAYIVTVIALQKTMKVGLGAAIAAVIVVALIGLGFAVLFAK